MVKPLSDIGAAVIGSGFIGTVHVEALRRMGVTVHGLLGSSSERAARRATQLGVPRAYGSLDDLLADPRVDVVHVTSPNQLHYPQVKAILAAGRHVVCEKPLAVTSAESAELVRLAAASDRITAVNYNIRFYPLNQHLHGAVRAGELGDIRLVTGRYFQDWLFLDTDWNWRLDPEQGGTLRAFGDIGTHWVDLVSFITGSTVTSVLAELVTAIPVRQQPTRPVETFSTERSTDTLPRTMTTEDIALLLLRFANGARGSVAISQVSPGRKNSLQYEIDGSRSAASWDSETPDHLWIGHRDAPNEILQRGPALMNAIGAAAASLPGGHVEGFGDTFHALFRAIYAAVAAGHLPEHPTFASFADGHQEMLIGDAVLRSARDGAWVDVAGDDAEVAPAAQTPEEIRPMKLGFLTAPFPDTPLFEVADWAAANGFESLEIACWPRTTGSTRRYAGTSHIDVADLGAGEARDLTAAIIARGLSISGLGFYPNPLHPDPEHRASVIAHLRLVIEAAQKMSVPFVNTFMGGDASKTQDANWEEALVVWPDIVRFAQDHGVRLTIENCPMIFSNDEWPGGHNIAWNPRIWRRILEQWAGAIGLNFDPSHLVWLMIDQERFIREFGPHILHMQAKDLMIDREGLYERGTLSSGMGWQIPRIPGLGEVDWRVIFAALYRAGYDGDIIIEHEDRVFEGTDELVKRGFLLSRDVLRPYIK